MTAFVDATPSLMAVTKATPSPWATSWPSAPAVKMAGLLEVYEVPFIWSVRSSTSPVSITPVTAACATSPFEVRTCLSAPSARVTGKRGTSKKSMGPKSVVPPMIPGR